MSVRVAMCDQYKKRKNVDECFKDEEQENYKYKWSCGIKQIVLQAEMLC